MQNNVGQAFLKSLKQVLNSLLVPLLAILTAIVLGGIIISHRWR